MSDIHSEMTDTPTLERPTSATAEDPEGFALSSALVVVSEPDSRATEAFRAMRTHIMAQHVSEGRRALAICAPNIGVGCTFVAANLAVAISQAGVKTMLIDADMRRPSLENLIRPPHSTSGLAQCLDTPDSEFGDAINHEVLANLSIIYAGASVRTPQELLASDRFKDLMDYCLREYDVTIVDTAPANLFSDARRISTVVGYSLIVAGNNSTYVADIRTLAGQIQADHAQVVGTVLNQA